MTTLEITIAEIFTNATREGYEPTNEEADMVAAFLAMGGEIKEEWLA